MSERDTLIADIRRMDEELARTPRVLDILYRSEFSRAAFRDEFGTWRGAIREALGTTRSVEVTRGEILARIIELHVTVEQDPSIETWTEETLYNPRAIYEDAGFDSWTDAKQSVGIVVWHRTASTKTD